MADATAGPVEFRRLDPRNHLPRPGRRRGPTGMAADQQGNVWLANEAGGSVTLLSLATATPLNATAYTGAGAANAQSIAITAR